MSGLPGQEGHQHLGAAAGQAAGEVEMGWPNDRIKVRSLRTPITPEEQEKFDMGEIRIDDI